MKLVDLLNSVDKKYKEEVTIICNKWRKKVQEGIKEMMRFKMMDDTKIKFRVNEAYPEKLLKIVFTEEEFFKYKLYQHKSYLLNLKSDIIKFPIILKDVSENTDVLNSKIQATDRILKIIDELLHKSPSEDEFRNKFTNFNEDIFGIYKIKPFTPTFLFASKVDYNNSELSIEIFWTVIGLFAKRYNLNLEATTVTILSHEYAHAYSHVGIDANSHFWNTNNFVKTLSIIKEGIAEYFSYEFMKRNDDSLNRFEETYNFILNFSPEIYKEYIKWENPSLEAVRFAMMEIRNNTTELSYEMFFELIKLGKKKFP